MTRITELHVLRDGEPIHVHVLGAQPLSIGRAPTNDLVMGDALISWNHLQIWVDEASIWVQDLGSSNGTFLNGERVTGRCAARSGDLLRVGPNQELRLLSRAQPPPGPRLRAFALEELASGLRFPIRSDRLVIGGGPTAQVHVPGAAEPLATLLLHANGEVWLGSDEDDRPLDEGEPFEVGGGQFRVVEVDPTRAPTVTSPPDRYAYALTATLDGPTGPHAEVQDLNGEARHVVTAGNRATLLYLLGRQFADDQQAGHDPEECGWASDTDVAVGIWGRAKGANNISGLHVLIHRTRQELKGAGFDPWFIEKRRRYVRVRVVRADLR